MQISSDALSVLEESKAIVDADPDYIGRTLRGKFSARAVEVKASSGLSIPLIQKASLTKFLAEGVMIARDR